MDPTIPQKIIHLMTPVSKDRFAADVRIGLVYTSVRLDNGHTGIAWTGHRLSRGCGHQAAAGTLAGRPAKELLHFLADTDDSLSRTIGLATANALASGTSPPRTVSTEILSLIDVQPSDHVVMAGCFGPLIPRLRRIGCRLDILELDTDKPGTLPCEKGPSLLAVCDVALITATSLVTNTMDDLLSGLGRVRCAVILGPSAFMRPEVFSGTPVTHIAGVRIRDAFAVERVVSEGGGTKTLKPHVDFETICLDS